VLKWIGEFERRTTSADLAALPKILLSWSLKTCFRFRESCLLIPFASALNTWQNHNQVLPDAGHTDPLAIGAKKSFSTISFDKTSPRPLHLVQVLTLPPDDITRRLKRSEFYLWTTITIRVEMTSLITHESHSDYQHTSILTHSNSTTTTIRQQIPDFILQKPRKNCYCWFHRMRMFSDTAVLVKIPSEWENIHHRKQPRQPIKKRASIVYGSDRKWEAMSEREKLERGRRRFELFGYCSWYKTIAAVQEIIVWLADGIMFTVHWLIRTWGNTWWVRSMWEAESCCVYNLRFFPNDNIKQIFRLWPSKNKPKNCRFKEFLLYHSQPTLNPYNTPSLKVHIYSHYHPIQRLTSCLGF